MGVWSMFKTWSGHIFATLRLMYSMNSEAAAFVSSGFFLCCVSGKAMGVASLTEKSPNALIFGKLVFKSKIRHPLLDKLPNHLGGHLNSLFTVFKKKPQHIILYRGKDADPAFVKRPEIPEQQLGIHDCGCYPCNTRIHILINRCSDCTY